MNNRQLKKLIYHDFIWLKFESHTSQVTSTRHRLLGILGDVMISNDYSFSCNSLKPKYSTSIWAKNEI